ncbi:MAG: hypothetical protein EAY70_00030 [Sphingomonadales bacterium]|nr:MAG: hypothetical protein EAY70_00030 [Sphingomonadales bacterium]
MAGRKRSRSGERGKADAPIATADTAGTSPAGPGGLPLPSPVAATNLVIADIVLRSAGGLLRDRMEKGLLIKSYDQAKAERLVDGRGLATSVALWGASRLARRSPLGLALVAGGRARKQPDSQT